MGFRYRHGWILLEYGRIRNGSGIGGREGCPGELISVAKKEKGGGWGFVGDGGESCTK